LPSDGFDGLARVFLDAICTARSKRDDEVRDAEKACESMLKGGKRRRSEKLRRGRVKFPNGRGG
jgi:hypothetical protein